jgi:hypothetical protein
VFARRVETLRSGCARCHCGDPGRGVPFVLVETLWIETVSTFHPALPMRAAVVASVGAALALFALASLLPAPPRASVAQMSPVRAPIAAPVAYSRDSLAVLSHADSLNRRALLLPSP